LSASIEDRSIYKEFNCFLGVEDRDGSEEDVLVDEATEDRVSLFWEVVA